MKPFLPVLASFFLALSTFSNPQEDKVQPNLTGSWKLTSPPKNKSTRVSTFRKVGDEVVITRNDNVLTFVGTSVVEGVEQTNRLTFYTDGRGEENLWAGSKRPVKTVTTWDEGVLRILEIRKATFRGPYGVKKADLKFNVEWTLSTDGTKLTQRVRDNLFKIDPMAREAGLPALDVKHVYERQR